MMARIHRQAATHVQSTFGSIYICPGVYNICQEEQLLPSNQSRQSLNIASLWGFEILLSGLITGDTKRSHPASASKIQVLSGSGPDKCQEISAILARDHLNHSSDPNCAELINSKRFPLKPTSTDFQRIQKGDGKTFRC